MSNETNSDQIAEFRERASQYRREREHAGKGGYIPFHQGEITGWTLVLDKPQDWEPGVVFVPEDDGPLMITVGGDPDAGARAFMAFSALASSSHTIVSGGVTREPDPLWEAMQMADLEPREMGEKAINHVLAVIRDNPDVGWHMGLGTQAFALLTEAKSHHHRECATLEQVRRHYCPRNAAKPGQRDAARLRWLQDRLLNMPSEYLALLGLPSGGWSDLGAAIDRARQLEEHRATMPGPGRDN